MGITARLCPFTTSCVQRFLISGGKLGNHCKFFPGNRPKAAVILDFRSRFANHCKVFPGNSPKAAVILDFRPRFANHRKFFPGNRPKAAVILDFRPKLANHCKVMPVYDLLRAAIPDFRGGVNLAIAAEIARKQPNCCSDAAMRIVSPAAFVAATTFRVRF